MGIDIDQPFPKRPRLKSFDYTGIHAYFITILTKNHAFYFKDAEVVDRIINILIETAGEKRFKILTYCFMPDHLHLLLAGEDDQSNLKKFVSLFKQKSGYWFKKSFKEDLWHISYYDHILRKEESIESVASYILENPVRKGLVADFKEHPFSWSFWTDQS